MYPSFPLWQYISENYMFLLRYFPQMGMISLAMYYMPEHDCTKFYGPMPCAILLPILFSRMILDIRIDCRTSFMRDGNWGRKFGMSSVIDDNLWVQCQAIPVCWFDSSDCKETYNNMYKSSLSIIGQWAMPWCPWWTCIHCSCCRSYYYVHPI